jgi:hypothetical protein
MLDKASRDTRIAALARLALATKEFPSLPTAEDRKAMSAFFLIYLEDTSPFFTDVVVEACRHLEVTQKWFPKVAELVDACRVIATRREEQREASVRKALPPAPVSHEKIEAFKAQIRAAIGRKSMP